MPKLNTLKPLLLAAVVLCLPAQALAKLNVITTTTSMGMLAMEVGGDKVEVKTLAAPDRDTHYLQAKPSMMIALRKADLVISVGAALEVGWFPAALDNAANPDVLDGEKGNFEAADHIELIGQEEADRSKGDVHPEGNPHFNLDPLRMATLANALAKRLGVLDENNADYYRENAAALAAKLNALPTELKQQVSNAPGVVLMHKDGLYLLNLLSVPTLGFMEPVPGVPPTANHIKALADKLSDAKGVIIHAPYHQDSSPKKLAKKLGWDRTVLAVEPPKGAGFEEYRALLNKWATSLNVSK